MKWIIVSFEHNTGTSFVENNKFVLQEMYFVVYF